MSAIGEPGRRDRVRGSIIGTLVCDALGGPVQFKPPGTFDPIEGLRPVTPFQQPTGSWSDDGSLTLCLTTALIRNNGDFKDDVFARLACAWHWNGYLSSTDYAWDVGGATRKSLEIWRRIQNSGRSQDAPNFDAQAYKDIAVALNHEKFSGNGSLMRCAPVGLIYQYGDARGSRTAHRNMRAIARRQSEITHPFSACGDACALYACLVSRAAASPLSGRREGDEKSEMANQIAEEDISDRNLRDRLAQYPSRAHWYKKEASDMRSSGWVIDTLECALWAFFTTDTFQAGALRAVNLGGDSDTVGAVYGGLAGAFYGYEAIPQAWREGIAKREMVERIVDDFAKIAFRQADSAVGALASP